MLFEKIFPMVVSGMIGAVIAGGLLLLVQPKDAPPANPSGQQERVVVERVVDGDTFTVRGGRTVRLIGIDAPEAGACYATEATAALKELVEGKAVLLEKDLSGTDAFGRLLRHAIREVEDPNQDNINVAHFLLSRGFALKASSKGDNRYNDLLAAAQDDAQEVGRGLWSNCPDAKRENAPLRQQASQPPNAQCIIKGNVSEKGFGRTYYSPGCPNYSRVKIDPSRGDQWFCTAKEAARAGYEAAENCP